MNCKNKNQWQYRHDSIAKLFVNLANSAGTLCKFNPIGNFPIPVPPPDPIPPPSPPDPDSNFTDMLHSSSRGYQADIAFYNVGVLKNIKSTNETKTIVAYELI